MSEQEKGPGGMSRRDFLKLLGAAGTAMAFAPFVPWGKYMPNPSSSSTDKAAVILPDGTQANINTSQDNLGFEPKVSLEQGIKSYIPEIKRLHGTKII